MADWPTRSVSCRSCCLISECYLPCLTKIVPTTCRRDSGLDRRNARSSCPRREHPWVLPSADARTAPSPSDAVRLPATARRGARSSRTGPAGCASVVAVACEDGASAVPRRHATRAQDSSGIRRGRHRVAASDGRSRPRPDRPGDAEPLESRPTTRAGPPRRPPAVKPRIPAAPPTDYKSGSSPRRKMPSPNGRWSDQCLINTLVSLQAKLYNTWTASWQAREAHACTR